MDLDAKVCYCFHVTRRKLVNFVRQSKPKVASQLSECGGAGTGCGWCIPFLKQIFQQGAPLTPTPLPSEGERGRGEGAAAGELEKMTPDEYARRRAAYIRAGKGTPPAGATP